MKEGQIISGSTISTAWAEAVLKLIESPGGRGGPFYVTARGVSNNSIDLDAGLIGELDGLLQTKKGGGSVQTVSNTIFPASMWNREAPRENLYSRYEKVWPAIKPLGNRRGNYFRRLTAYQPKEATGEPVNQLERVLSLWEKQVAKGQGLRPTALQMAIFDPTHDHVPTPRLGFPCLQQVSLEPQGSRGKDGLVISGFYPTQYFIDKALGNYIGLARLGQFVATHMGLELVGVRCTALNATLGDNWSKAKLGWSRSGLSGLAGTLEAFLDSEETQTELFVGDGAVAAPQLPALSC